MAPNCTVEDPCTNDVLRAALAGVQGLTTADKLETPGRIAATWFDRSTRLTIETGEERGEI